MRGGSSVTAENRVKKEDDGRGLSERGGFKMWTPLLRIYISVDQGPQTFKKDNKPT